MSGQIEPKTIAVVGGTGKEGFGLALRWAHAGHKVIIGSRTAEKAETAAEEINTILGRSATTGAANPEAASQADIVVLTVPYAAQQSTAEDIRASLDGKILIDVTVPLKPPKVNRVSLPDGRSAVEALQDKLGEGVKVVSAFQNVSAHHLKQLDHEIDCDVLVCSDDVRAVTLLRATTQLVCGDAGRVSDIVCGVWRR